MAFLRTVISALDVMEYLGSCNGEPVRLTDISRELHYPKAKVYRILTTLKQRKYIWQDPATHGYTLSLRTWLLGHLTNIDRLLTSVIEPYVDALSTQTQETSIFAMLDGVKAVHMYVSQTLNPLLAYVGVGSRVPLHASATGKAMLAHLGSHFIIQKLPPELEKFTNRTIVDRNRLIREVEKIQQIGYATGVDEISEGLSGVAAASVMKEQMIYWAIGISGPTARISTERLDELGKLAMNAVLEIEQKLKNEIG